MYHMECWLKKLFGMVLIAGMALSLLACGGMVTELFFGIGGTMANADKAPAAEFSTVHEREAAEEAAPMQMGENGWIFTQA